MIRLLDRPGGGIQVFGFGRCRLIRVIGSRQSGPKICKESANLSEAGRRLFNKSRTQRSVLNDADRLRKYLLKFDLRRLEKAACWSRFNALGRLSPPKSGTQTPKLARVPQRLPPYSSPRVMGKAIGVAEYLLHSPGDIAIATAQAPRSPSCSFKFKPPPTPASPPT